MKASEKLLARAVIATAETYRPVEKFIEILQGEKARLEEFLPFHRRKARRWTIAVCLIMLAMIVADACWLMISDGWIIKVVVFAIASLLVAVYGFGTGFEQLEITKIRLAKTERDINEYKSRLPQGDMAIMADFLSRAFGRYGTSRLDKAVDAVNSARASVISITAAIDTVVSAKLISREEAECMRCGVESALESIDKAGKALCIPNSRIVMSNKIFNSNRKTTLQQKAARIIGEMSFANKEIANKVMANDLLQREDSCAAILRGLDALDEIAACDSPVKFKQLDGSGRLQEITKDINACYDTFYS